MAHTPTPKTASHWGKVIGLGIAGSILVALVVLAFLWPTKTMEAQNLPVSITGPNEAVSAIEDAVAEQGDGAIEFVRADDRDAAVNQVETRETYGAIVLSASAAPEVLTAPAGSAVATQLLNGVATQLQAQLTQQVAAAGGDPAAAPQVQVTPVVELSDADPTGSGLTAAAFPLMLGGMLGGILVSLVITGVWHRLTAVAVFAAATSIVLTLVMQSWFEYLQGDFWLNVLAISMSILATGMFIVGCATLLGNPGVGVGAVVTMLVGNPLSAAAMPWQFIVEPWGAVGQFMVPGASNWLLRSLSYFPEANNAQQWWTLAGWVVLGIVLALIGAVIRGRRTVTPATPERDALEHTAADAAEPDATPASAERPASVAL